MSVAYAKNATVEVAPGLRTCVKCLELKPIEDFRRFRAKQELRHSECKVCHAAAQRARTQKRDSKRFKDFNQTVNRARSTNEMCAAVRALVLAVGGIDRFAVFIATQLEAATKRKSGGKQSVDGFRAIVNLMVAVEKLRPEADYSDVEQEDVDVAFRNLELQAVDGDPERFADALRARGYCVIAPSGDSNGTALTAEILRMVRDEPEALTDIVESMGFAIELPAADAKVKARAAMRRMIKEDPAAFLATVESLGYALKPIDE